MIRAVVFDVGEVLVDESREYGRWADWLGVPRHTFSAVFGAVIASGRDHRETFQVFRPGFDLVTERAVRAAAGQAGGFAEQDLYPEVLHCLSHLHGMGLQVGVAGNQPASFQVTLENLGLPVDWIATSSVWGVAKPSPEFFAHIVERCDVRAEEIVYVGDRLDNDIRPALDSGLQTVLVRRGPWGLLLSDPDTEQRCLAVIADLNELQAVVANHIGPRA